MLGFVIPFKAKSKSRNWENDCLLLQRTLRSVCNQKGDAFKVFVVYSDFPLVKFNSNKIKFIQFPFPFVSNDELKQLEIARDPQSESVIDERMFDQGKRILFGCELAKKNNCDFVMSVDADDFVSNKISQYVLEHTPIEKIGWHVNKGYILKKNSALLLKITKNMNHINASTHIVHINLIPAVNFESKSLSEFSFFAAHGYLKERIRISEEETLKPLPFFALIYFIHDSNWAALGTSMKKHWIKTMIKYLLFGRRLNGKIRQEFGLSK